MDFDLTQEASHLAIKDSGGLDLLINLLETEDIRCRVGTLRILREISKNSQTRTAIVDLKGQRTRMREDVTLSVHMLVQVFLNWWRYCAHQTGN